MNHHGKRLLVTRQAAGSIEGRYHAAVIAYDEPFDPPVWIEQEFNKAGVDFSMANCLTEGEVIDFACGKDVLLTSSARKLLTRQVIERLDVCRALVRVGSGIDCIDVAAATDRGIVVINTPDPLAEEVSDHTAALLLDCVRSITHHDSLVKHGAWRPDALPLTRRMRGKTLGFVGFGRIARVLAEKLSGFRLHYLAYDPYLTLTVAREWDVGLVSLDELLSRADFVSLHAQLTDETYHLIGERELKLMQPHAILINTARGDIVDQMALHKALEEGWIAGAGLDVLEWEPPSADEPLLRLPNVVVTPHVAAWSDELMGALYTAGCRVAVDLLEGRWPPTVVNPQVQPWWTKGA
jgi:D-3-phosphoglycerate dehydrogenase